MAQYGKSPFKTVAPRKKTLRIAKKIISDPDSLTENERKIGNNLLKRLKKQGRTLANYIKFEGKAPPSPPAPERKPTSPSIAARSRARVDAQRDIDEDVAGRGRPAPVIKSPTDPSKRRPTQAERENERKKREAARRRQTMEIFADPSGLESGRGMPKKKKKVQKPKIGTPSFAYQERVPVKGGGRRGRTVTWDAGKLTKKDLANLVGQEALDFPKSLPKSRRRGPLGDTSYAAILGDVDPSRYKDWKKPTTASAKPVQKPRVVAKPPPPEAAAADKRPPPRPRRKPKQPESEKRQLDISGPGSWPEEKRLDISGPGSWPKDKKAKKDVREKYPTKGTRRALKPLEGGVRYYTLPDWLGGGRVKVDSTFRDEEGDNVTHGKKGGQVKKGVKKTKAKARKRAALRGHRAELRGG